MATSAGATNGSARQCSAETFGQINIPQEHLERILDVDRAAGFLSTQVRGWLLLRNSRLGPQERAAILSGTGGDTILSKVAEKLLSQWSDHDLAFYSKGRKGPDRRAGAAHGVIEANDDEELPPGDDLWPENGNADGAYGNDSIYYNTRSAHPGRG